MSDVDWDRSRRPSRYAPPPRRKKRRLPWILALAGVIIVFLALNLRRPPPGTGVQEMPEQLLGRWTTDDARYQGRALRLTRDSVVFDVGPDQSPRRGRILSLRRWKEGLVPVFRIEYDAGEGVETMDVLVVGPDSIRFRNPRDVLWTKAP